MRTKTSLLSMTALGLCALASACGGSGDSATDAKFAANSPSFDQVSLQIDDSDAVPGSNNLTTAQTDEEALSTDKCHPHLFSRTHEIVGRLNRHTDKHLARIRRLLAKNADLAAGQSRTWTGIDEDGVGRKFTMTKSAAGDSFTFELDLAAKGTTTFVKVFNGEVTASSVTTGTNTVTDKLGSMTFDYDALHSVVPAEKATGKIEVDFDVTHDPSKPAPGIKKVLNIKMTAFLPEEGDPHGPRTGSYLHVGEPGIGGRLTFQDSLILLCPANPNGAVADTNAVSRWYKGADGKIHGRGDAKATGGQIPAGDTWSGVSCHNGVRADRDSESGYWMMKLEDGTGATIHGTEQQTTDAGASPCDAALGAVPSLANNATDYDFSAAVSFPNEW